MRKRSAWLKVLPDLPVFAGMVFGALLVARPEWFGLAAHGALPIAHVVNPPFYIFPLVLIAILWCALRASEHAEAVAIKLPDPFGSLVLTISAVFIEVALVIGVMMTGTAADTVARDTMFATLMMILNGLVGLALIAGALRKREQPFNAQSSSSYLGVIGAICTIGLVLPRFTTSEPGGYMSDQMDFFVAGASFAVYGAFLFLQSSSHRDFFVAAREEAQSHVSHSHLADAPLWKSICLLVIALLSVLSTIGLTIPAVLFVAMLFGKRVELGLQAPEICLLAATMVLSMLHFGAGKTNMMQGIVHAMLFAVWIALLLDPRTYL